MQDKTESTQIPETRAPWEEKEEKKDGGDEKVEKSENNENEVEEDGEAEKEADDELAMLRAEIDRLRAELSEAQSVNERVNADIEEFRRLFPNADLAGLPEEVTDGVRAGTPLSAAYALYERRIAAERERKGLDYAAKIAELEVAK